MDDLYAVTCREHGYQTLPEEEYQRQLQLDAPWVCPCCGVPSLWVGDDTDAALQDLLALVLRVDSEVGEQWKSPHGAPTYVPPTWKDRYDA